MNESQPDTAGRSHVASAHRHYQVGDLQVDLVARKVRRNGATLPVKGLSFEMLACLVRLHPELASNREINSAVWGDNFVGGSTLTQRVKLLREALSGSERYEDYIETVKSRGYRLRVPVEPVREELQSEAHWLSRKSLLALLALGLVAAGTWVLWPDVKPEQAGRGTHGTLFVLPIRNSTGDVEWAEGVRQEILERLGTIDTLSVTPVQEIPAAAGEALALEPELIETDEGYELRGTLRDLRSGKVLAEQRTPGAGPGQSVRRATQSFAAGVAKEVPGGTSTVDGEGMDAIDPQAYELYLRARYHSAQYARSDLRRGIQLLDRALEIEPGFARGLELRSLIYTLGGTPSYGWMPPDEAFYHARKDALQALALDPRMTLANVTLGNIFLWHDWNPVAARMAYQQALDLDPDALSVWLSIALMHTVLAEYEESLAAIDRAIELAPMRAGVYANAGWRLIGARRYEDALEAARRAEQLDPTMSDAGEIRVWALVYLGRAEQALAESDESLSEALRGYLLAVVGKEAEARRYLHKLLEAQAGTYIAPSDIALILIGLGDYEEALNWLEKVVEQRSREALFFRSSAVYDSLRDHPRFIDLMHRVGIWDDFSPRSTP